MFGGSRNIDQPSCVSETGKLHVALSQACLHVKNNDAENELELWAQAEECYKCSPWLYLTLGPEEETQMVVNSTYSTMFFIGTTQSNKIKGSYHFEQYGIYHMNLSLHDSINITTLQHGNNEYMSIVFALIFYGMLSFMYISVSFLRKRMDESTNNEEDTLRFLAESRNTVDQLHENRISDSNGVPTSSTAGCSRDTVSSNTNNKLQIDTRNRLHSLDTFRGLCIVLMIFVNYGGGKYYFFNHARWNGLTIADLVFPWFLWIMGVSLTFSVKSQLHRITHYYKILCKITIRAVKLFCLGILVNSIKSNYLPRFRILGVLQRFAFSYLINASIEVYNMMTHDFVQYSSQNCLRDVSSAWLQWVIVLDLVIIHTIVTFVMPVNGCPSGYIGPGGVADNSLYPQCTGGAAGYVDKLILGSQHLHPKPTSASIYDSNVPYDPEGILGTLTACLTVQLGVVAGRIILTYPNHMGRIYRWMIWSTFLCGIGGVLCGWSKEDGLIPVNKNLWSLSFVLLTGGFAFALFAVIYVAVDVCKCWDGTPFRVPGMNSIFLYVGHELTHTLLPWSWTPVGHHHTDYLVMNLWGTSLWIIISYICYHKKLFFAV